MTQEILFEEEQIREDTILPSQTPEVKTSDEIIEETIAQKRPVFLLNVDYDRETNGAILTFYVQEYDVLIKLNDSTGHKPYYLNRNNAKEVDRIIGRAKEVLFIDEQEKFDPLSGKMVYVSRIVVDNPLAVPKLRGEIDGSLEANIRYHICYIHDRGLNPGMPYRLKRLKGNIVPVIADDVLNQTELENILKALDLRQGEYDPTFMSCFTAEFPRLNRAAIDIETESLDSERTPGRIISFSFAGNDGKRGVHVLMREDFSDFECPEGMDYGLDIHEEERDLISALFKILESYPIILTYNGDEFDLKYIMNRWTKLGGDKNDCPIYSTRAGCLLKNALHIDLFPFMSNRSIANYAFSGKYQNYKLDTIAKGLLGIGKVEHEEEIINLSFADLIRYNMQDSDITLQLTTFDDEIMIQLMLTLMRLTKTTMEDLVRDGISAWFRNLIQFYHRKREWIIPTRSDITKLKGESAETESVTGKKYKGAFVADPVPGVHFNVVTLDFASLYPSIVETKNLSYETINCEHEECKTNKIPDTEYWTCTRVKGIGAEVIGLIKNIRVKHFKKMEKTTKDKKQKSRYKVMSQALKVLANAGYGIFGSADFDFYCLPVAESITACGRFDINTTIEFAKKNGGTVIYGDTDSMFLRDPSEELIRSVIEMANDRFNIELEVDKKYRFACFSARKKNYFGVLENGEIDIKGMQGKKKNIPLFIRNLFGEITKILSKVMTQEQFDEAKEKVKKAVKITIKKLKNGKIPLEELAFVLTLNKNIESYGKNKPQHVKVAVALQERTGKKIGAGDIVSYIKVSSKEGAVALSMLDDPRKVDIKKYTEALKTTLEQLFDPLDINFEEASGKQNLFSIMSKKLEKDESSNAEEND